MRRLHRRVVGILAGALLAPAPATARPGDLDEPLVVPAAPFVHASTTVGRSAAIHRYDCAPSISEEGPEVVYRIEVTTAGSLSAWVDGDASPIDVDVQILQALEVDADGLATGCLARDNRGASASVEAGTHYVVVDSYQGAQRAGPYRLRLDLVPADAWYERTVAKGVMLRTRTHADLDGVRESTAVLEVDLGQPGVSVRPIAAGGCTLTSTLGRTAGAVAAVNGGFFDTSTGRCESVSLLKVDGTVIATSSVSRTALGIDSSGEPHLQRIAAGAEWPEMVHALGGVPRIVSNGAVDVRTAEEGASQSFETTRHPRTAVGLESGSTLLLVAVDGRTSAGAGMSLPELARWMIDLGTLEALNLDGGGSTTLWVATEPFGGVVNHPSDNGLADHQGERRVGSALGVFAPALDRDAIWLTSPPTRIVARGEPWLYEVAAADPEGAPIRFALEGSIGGERELIDRGDTTARVRVVPGPGDGAAGPLLLTLVAQVEGSRPISQTLRIEVRRADGGAAPDGGTPDGGGSDAGIAGGGANPGGCSCAASGPVEGGFLWLLVGAWLAVRPRRRGAPAGSARFPRAPRQPLDGPGISCDFRNIA